MSQPSAGRARAADVDERLDRLPRGYDTLLSRTFTSESDKDDPDTGVVLSGGQWQRVALARAFVRDRCELMILDEPSSGLDVETEHRLTEQLRRHRRGRTSLLVSHRLGTLRDADLIAVLVGGRVAELGDPARRPMVAEVAYRWGFTHRFAQDCRARYGESPSQTLHGR